MLYLMQHGGYRFQRCLFFPFLQPTIGVKYPEGNTRRRKKALVAFIKVFRTRVHHFSPSFFKTPYLFLQVDLPPQKTCKILMKLIILAFLCPCPRLNCINKLDKKYGLYGSKHHLSTRKSYDA